jgi:DNA mismatch repair protein MutS2
MIYPENFESKTGFDRIRSMLSERCLSPMGLRAVEAITFMTDFEPIDRELSKTSEFQQLLRFEDPFPSDNYFDTEAILSKLRVEGTFPDASEVFNLKRSLETVKAVLNYFKSRKENSYSYLKAACSDVKMYPYVLDAIDRVIDRFGKIKDNASPALREIRSDLAAKTASVSKRLHSILKQAQADGLVETDANVSVRNGRGVIPVSVYDKRKIRGLIHDQSASGKTVFIEPAEVVELNNEIIELEYSERREIVKILTSLADNIRPYIDELLVSNTFLGEIDFLRAKALLGNYLGSVKPVLSNEPGLSWSKAIHPLLFVSFSKTKERKVVPLNITLTGKERLLVISGPNAGGKSVCLKTVGLLQYMLQCGITIPVADDSSSGLFDDIYIDIGDEQSIDNDLSTYSSHLMNMKFFLRNATTGTLVLIDEFGTGTEPMLGGSIAEAILGALNSKGVYGVLTTHYTNLKHFASVTPGIVNGAMAFDNHLMQPLFQLFIGKPGSSFAFEIARKIGLPDEILSSASEKAGVKNIKYDRHLKDIARDKRYWENKRQNIRQHEKKLEELIEEYEKELSAAKKAGKEIITRAKDEARQILDNSNRIIENTVREIKEAQAEKEKTKELRQQVDELKNEILKEKDVETEAGKKAAELRTRAVRFRKTSTSGAPEKEQKKDKTLKPGDAVRMIDTMIAGEVTEVRDGMVHVETGSFRVMVSPDKVEKISKSELRKSRTQKRSDVFVDEEIASRKLRFKPEIDIRGFRGEEAITQVQQLLDDAVIVQHRNLRILHGKGNGILRELVRNYLSASGIVKSYRDENVEYGGSGITLVELDL